MFSAKRIACPTSAIFNGDKLDIKEPIFPLETVCR